MWLGSLKETCETLQDRHFLRLSGLRSKTRKVISKMVYYTESEKMYIRTTLTGLLNTVNLLLQVAN